MRRIPFGSGTGGDNLVDVTGGKFMRADGRADVFVFGIGPDTEQMVTVDGLRKYLTDNLTGAGRAPPSWLTSSIG